MSLGMGCGVWGVGEERCQWSMAHFDILTGCSATVILDVSQQLATKVVLLSLCVRFWHTTLTFN